jgi:carboxypeptidase T
MKKLLFSLLFLTLMVSPVIALEQIVTVPVRNHADVVRISNMGMDIAEVNDDIVTLVVRDEEVQQLATAGYKINRTIGSSDDLRKRFANKTAADAGAYHTWEESRDKLLAWAKKYPKIAKIQVIGKTFENRDVHALKISAAPAGKKVPKFLVMGLHHSREWITVEVVIDFGRILLEGFDKDANITSLLKDREVWLVPVVNPDGLNWSQTQYSYWRKNRNDNNGHSSKGVDPNRNYGYQWGNVGASDSPSSNTYHGTGPFSEPCTQNIKRLAEKEKFAADISYHSSGQLILYPWSYTGNHTCPDDALFSRLAKEMAALNNYRPQQSADLYPSMGDTDDWMYGAMGSLSFTFELARQFIPAESLIPSICEKNNKAMLHLLKVIGTERAAHHPDYASTLHFQTARLAFFEGQARELRAKGQEESELSGLVDQITATRSRILAELTDSADADGSNFRELITLLSARSVEEREIYLPLLQEIRSLLLQKESMGTKFSCRRLEMINRLLPTE